MQEELTNSHVQVRIAENQGEAALARARKEAEQLVVTAEAESRQRILAGRGESSRVMQIGLSEAAVLLRKIQSFSDPRLYALSLVVEQLAQSKQPLVPERVFMAGGSAGGDSSASAAGTGLLGTLLGLLVAEKSGFGMGSTSEDPSVKEMSDRLVKEVMASIENAVPDAKPNENGVHA